MPRERDTGMARVSKSLSWLLRHGAIESGLELTSDGFAKISDIQRLPSYKTLTVDTIRHVVTADAKNRYSLRENEDGEVFICANQGHSIVIEQPCLKPILTLEDCPQAIHGTYHRFMSSILEKGLKRMTRTHIHFSRVEPSSDHAVSGIRPSCQVLIYLDVKKALADGLPLFESVNEVILSPGNKEGCIPKEYFLKIVDRAAKV